jgi:glutamine kinase
MNEFHVNEETVDIFFLGAGKPVSGKRPSALKEMGASTCALDWQLHSLEAIECKKINFLGGYHVEEVIERYPHLHYTVIPDWQTKSMFYTLSEAHLRRVPTVITYADTIFRKEVIAQVAKSNADVTILCDSHWERRYDGREKKDLQLAEVISLIDGKYCVDGLNKNIIETKVEFTGVVKFSPETTEFVSDLDEGKVGRTLLDLIGYLFQQGYQINVLDVKGEWAEFNSPRDIAHFILGTKAETLSRLAPLVTTCHIGKQVSFKASEWQLNKQETISRINKKFSKAKLIIRSSAKGEDSWGASNAGGFESVINVDGGSNDVVVEAIELVIDSYGDLYSENEDQVLVQEFIGNVKYSGVVFTCSLETGAPYYRINFDDKTSSTTSVTSGAEGELRTVLVGREGFYNVTSIEPKLLPLLTAIKELEGLLGFDKLDIEFAVDRSGVVHIFQIRPITVDHSDFEVEKKVFDASVLNAQKNFRRLQTKTPFILGSKTFFGNMPDWNPAEIIGIRPSPLAFSLYRWLITDCVWATQRAEFGYRDVRPHPLMVCFCGQPYVDIRASLNSFIPSRLAEQTAEKIIDSYLSILQSNPHLHDKLEFDVAFTVWTPTFKVEAVKRLTPHGISIEQIDEMEHELKGITQGAILRLDDDIKSIHVLIERRALLENSDLLPIDKAMMVLEDCKRFGSLAFAHAARAGFVAMSFLKSFVSLGILTEKDKHAFLKTIKTVAGEFEKDGRAILNKDLSKETYLKRYGHLRPGTYDVTIEAYWEAPQRYLSPSGLFCGEKGDGSQFQFSGETRDAIVSEFKKIDTEFTFDQIINYIKKAIQAREYIKFEFTSNLSRALDMFVECGLDLEFTRESISYLNVNDFEQLKVGSLVKEDLPALVKQRMQNILITQMVELPQVLFQESDFYCFERYASQPNFITGKRVEAEVLAWEGKEVSELDGKIVLISQADPGYDWLFNHNITGLITKYGGANSHMAIRAAEMGLPAAIGIGDKLYEQFSNTQRILLDCANQLIRTIR